MTVTLVESLPLTIPEPNASKLARVKRYDPLESEGSLIIFDARKLDPGVPADGATLPNLAETTAQQVIGTADPAKVRPKIIVPAAFTGSAGKFERTGKGGLHGISPRGGNALAGTGPTIYFPTAMTTYILSNPTHDFYASVWGRLTRGPATSYNNSTWFGINGDGQQTNSSLINIAPNGSNSAGQFGLRPVAGNPPRLGLVDTPSNSQTGNHFKGIGTTGWVTHIGGTPMSEPNSLPGDGGPNQGITGTRAGIVIPWGSSAPVPAIGAPGGAFTTVTNAYIDPTTATGNKDKADSHIIYRVLLEDLTVSGRTFAQVSALDAAEYEEQVLTLGGDFFGDTFTDPATIA